MKKEHVGILVLVGLVILVGAYSFFTNEALAPQGEGTAQTGSYIYSNSSSDVLFVNSPRPGESVGQVFSVSGSARGYWYFEASFPIKVEDGQGNVLAEAVAQAEGDWMTEDFVPFKARIELPSGVSGNVYVTLKKDNPSGDPERDASVSFPLVIQ